MKKAGQSNFVINIVKEVIKNMNLHWIYYDDILFVRSSLQEDENEIEIFRLPLSIINTIGKYFFVEIYPHFDLLAENLQYRKVFHVLKHIPENYKESSKMVKHDEEVFADEMIFVQDFKKRLGWK